MQSLTNHFLIAMPDLEDPNFSRSVTLICHHSEDEGAIGITLTRATDHSVEELLDQLDIQEAKLAATHALPLYIGGPVEQDRGFILHPNRKEYQWEGTETISDHLAITSSLDILEDLARGKGPDNCLIALGYAGWSSGQLEQEITDNAWLHGPADPEIIFSLPAEQRWTAAAQSLGVDIRLIHSAGHA
ncbi:conserved hypothetical protein [gamma proteobacterium HTCC5015]|nr:conserved hypothetical protein [gamma proteobacterium HTCC5015]